jgi:hypothetical protein
MRGAARWPALVRVFADSLNAGSGAHVTLAHSEVGRHPGLDLAVRIELKLDNQFVGACR